MSLIIEPSDLLTFQRPLTSVTKETLLVKNPNAEPVIFKVKTTAPKQYCVRPNAGRIDGNSQVEVQVILQPFKVEPPFDIKCKDKFLVQSAQIQPEEYGSTPVTEIWSRIEKEDQGSIRQHKIKCSFASPTQETNTATETIPPHIVSDNNAPTTDIGSSQHETQKDHPSTHSSNNDTILSAHLPEEENTTTNVKIETTAMEQPNDTDLTGGSNVEQQVHAAAPQPPQESQTATPVTAIPASAIQTDQQVPSVNDHQPTPSTTELKDEKKQPTPKTNDDDNEKQKLRQELAAAQQLIMRLEKESEQHKKDMDGLRLRQNATTTTGATAGTRKLPSTVQPLDAVHQHLAQLQKPRSVEGYPPNVVLAMCFAVFLFTYIFL